MDKKTTVKCYNCKSEISIKEKVCPHCGKKIGVLNKTGLLGLVCIIVLAFIIALLLKPLLESMPNPTTESIIKATETDKTTAENIYSILQEIDVKNLESISYDEMLDDLLYDNSNGYRITCSAENSEEINIIMFLDDSNLNNNHAGDGECCCGKNK